MTYAEEKLYLAIFHCFAIDEGDSRSRLSNGFRYYLHTLKEENFTKSHWNRFQKVKNRIVEKGPLISADGIVIVGAFENAKTGMKNKTASKLIQELVAIYEELRNQ
jgi:hypothetical protein